MGKQINYYMEYESFLIVAQKALEFGAVILKRTSEGKILQSSDISIITPDYGRYVFYFPEFAPLVIHDLENGQQKFDCFATASGNAMIEAGFSRCEGRTINRARLYIQSGYCRNSDYISRSEEMTSVFHKLVRLVKKLTKYQFVAGSPCKEYISPHYLDLIENHGFQIR